MNPSRLATASLPIFEAFPAWIDTPRSPRKNGVVLRRLEEYEVPGMGFIFEVMIEGLECIVFESEITRIES